MINNKLKTKNIWRGGVMAVFALVMLIVQPVQAQSVDGVAQIDAPASRNIVEYSSVGEGFEGWWLIPLLLLPAILWAISQFDQPKEQRFTKPSRQAFDLAYYHDLRPRRKFKSRFSTR